jgi:ribonuclease HI
MNMQQAKSNNTSSAEATLVHIDGSSLGNPGPSGAGVVFFDENGKQNIKLKKYLGEATNNIAEYSALILALNEALKHGIRHLLVKTDSELLAKQINGNYKVKNEGLKKLHAIACKKTAELESFKIEHTARENNKAADSLAFAAANSKT